MIASNRAGRATTLAVGILAMVVTATSLTACKPAPDTYVALGDSFVAGPLIPIQSAGDCMRSSQNYPNVARASIKATKFVDASCSGAKVNDFFYAQGSNPPQIDSLDDKTKVVTVGIGGNDIGFSDIVQTCALQAPWGSGCTGDFVSGGQDELMNRINTVGPRFSNALTFIKAKAPNAKVFVVGYPTVVPETGNGCYPLVPVLGKDIPYLRAKVKELNTMLRTRTEQAGATYIDIATPSIGHDFCAGGQKWVEGIVPTSLAAPVHPNAAGMAAFGTIVSEAINAVVTK